MSSLFLGQPVVKQKQLLNHKEEKLICEVRTPDGKQYCVHVIEKKISIMLYTESFVYPQIFMML